MEFLDPLETVEFTLLVESFQLSGDGLGIVSSTLLRVRVGVGVEAGKGRREGGREGGREGEGRKWVEAHLAQLCALAKRVERRSLGCTLPALVEVVLRRHDDGHERRVHRVPVDEDLLNEVAFEVDIL